MGNKLTGKVDNDAHAHQGDAQSEHCHPSIPHASSGSSFPCGDASSASPSRLASEEHETFDGKKKKVLDATDTPKQPNDGYLSLLQTVVFP